jgi:DNA-binding transcriptional regulator LsrR (DeoR family)
VLNLPRSFEAGKKKMHIGRFAADIIHGHLYNGENIGMTFGTSLQQAVEALSLKQPVNINCVQLTGSLGAADAAFDGHQLVNKLSSSWNCFATYLHAPLMVNSEEIRKQLFSSRSNKPNAECCRNLDAAVVGLSPLDAGGNSALFTGGHITAGDMKIMRDHNIVGDIGAYSIDSEGELVEIDSLVKMIGIDGNEFRKIERRFGLAVGDSKAGVIRAALKGGWFTTLIIDQQAAELVLSE